MVCNVEHDDSVELRYDDALHVVLGFPGSSIESGSIAREIHLKWPRSVNHLGKAISLTRRRSAVKRAKSLLDRQIIRCFVFGRKKRASSDVETFDSVLKISPNSIIKCRERVLDAQGGNDVDAGDLLYEDEDDLDHLDDEDGFQVEVLTPAFLMRLEHFVKSPLSNGLEVTNTKATVGP